MVATDRRAEPTGYGLGRHGWVSIDVGDDADESRWLQVEEWVRTSYTMVAPKTLARIAGPTADPDDDLIVEARITSTATDPCVARPPNGGSLHVSLLGMLLIGLIPNSGY